MAHAFRQGDHICSISDTEEQQLTTAATYLTDGIERGERCVYVAETRAVLQRFDVALRAAGLDAALLRERGALIELTHAEAHLIGGRFDCERTLAMIDDAIRQAIADGFSGLRMCGDMSWLLLDAPGSAEVASYEARLNHVFADTRSAAMCQYQSSASAGTLDQHGADHAPHGGRRRAAQVQSILSGWSRRDFVKPVGPDSFGRRSKRPIPLSRDPAA